MKDNDDLLPKSEGKVEKEDDAEINKKLEEESKEKEIVKKASRSGLKAKHREEGLTTMFDKTGQRKSGDAALAGAFLRCLDHGRIV